MRTVTLYRYDFVKTQDGERESLFNYVLSQLGIPEDKQEDIEQVDIRVESFETYDN